MSNQKSSYRSIAKATSIFGGVQVIQIVISIIRSKVIAVLLGPTGMGVAGLLTSSIQMISSLSNMGLGTSAVKDVSAAYASGNVRAVNQTVTVFRRWIWFTGAIGTISVIALSPWLSEWAFNHAGYTWAFIVISISLLIDQHKTAKTVLLRGMRKIKLLAKGNVVSSFLALLATLPLYYFFGIQGIAPAIILTSVVSLVVMTYFSRTLEYEKVNLPLKQIWEDGKDMLKMGFYLSLSGTFAGVIAYVVRIFISQEGSVDDVGFYTAGFAIINTYVGMIFSAMGMDYYPRLAGVAQDKVKFNQVIQQQAEVALLIIGPILCIFLIFINWGILLLYSQQFLPIYEMLLWAALGVFFKAASWPFGFAILSKGDSKVFMLKEIAINLALLGLNVLGFSLYGLSGLGISYLLLYVLNAGFLSLIMIRRYNIRYSKNYLALFGVQCTLGLACFAGGMLLSGTNKYLCGIPLILCSAAYSYYLLDKRMDLKGLIKQKLS